MKKLAILLILIIFLTSCVPSAEELAGVTREELISGKAVKKVLKINEGNEIPNINDSKQTLAEAHEKEYVDIAENAWNDLRQEPRVLEGGAVEAGVGQKFTVTVD
ncbi:hypothetical protein JW851_00885 [Candidatus Woesearchaeota archaeon]|nr:hypothetical protein [Candidatus Woesearchaeota archaeon]